MGRILKLSKNNLHKRIKPIQFICFILVSFLSLSGCTRLSPGEMEETKRVIETTKEYISASDFLLNTYVTIKLYDKKNEDILNGCFDLIARYETIYSRTSESSELYALNHRTLEREGDSYLISAELADILVDGLYYSKLTDGAFDLSIEPVSSLWDFTAVTPIVPKEEDIEAALTLVGYQNIRLEGNRISFAKEGNGIDLGAIAKGYIADRVKDYLLDNGVQSAMINLGGNVLCVGSKPDGTPYHVGIQKPFADRNETIAVMDIEDLSVVSSGVYERYFVAEGKHYHHILSPKTGYSYDNDLVSVTIISNKSTDGDGLSTSCFALGLEKGLDLIASLPNTYAIFITSDYAIHYSEGFEEAIKVTKQ